MQEVTIVFFSKFLSSQRGSLTRSSWPRVKEEMNNEIFLQEEKPGKNMNEERLKVSKEEDILLLWPSRFFSILY